MAHLYTSAQASFLGGEFDLLNDTIKCVLVKSAYTYSAAHDFLNDLSTNAVGTAQTLTTPDTTDGVFSADNATFTAVAATTACDRVAIYKHVTNSGDSPLIAILDLAAEVTPDGGDITLTWDAGGIFAFTG